jgi:uncharacterized protein YbjT (DUF2867 family)
MKIVVTGSLGNISKPLTEELVQEGHDVTVISSKPSKQKDIESLGAKAAIGVFEDVGFLTSAFSGADVVYCMLTSPGFFDPEIDLMAHIARIARNYNLAIRQSGVKNVIHLSSIGAHTDKGNGIIALHYQAEQIFQELPADVSIKHLRPVGFYYNLLGFVHGIKTQGFIASNYGAMDKIPWVSPKDIASVVAEEMTAPFERRKIRYIASEEISCTELAHILGCAIGKPDLKWILIPGDQLRNNLISLGMNPAIATGLVEMQDSIHSGVLYEDYYRHRPASLGPTKIKDFAKEFADVYNAPDQSPRI